VVGSKVAAMTLVLLLFLTAIALGQSIPVVNAESLNGKPISFPKDFAGKTAILVIGFSRGGGAQCGPFARKLAKEPNIRDGSVAIYQIAMLASAPRVIRPMILHGMRGGMPKEEQDRFLPLFHDEAQWKQVSGFSKSGENDAYLILVSSDGTVRWTTHGQYSDGLYLEFKLHLPG